MLEVKGLLLAQMEKKKKGGPELKYLQHSHPHSHCFEQILQE